MTSAAEHLAALDRLPRLGWVTAPTPVVPLPGLAAELGLGWLGCKRDDLLPPIHGGTKVRKLDYVLAAEPYASAPAWASSGAIGSGHMVAMTAAAAALGRRLDGYLFWQPASPRALETLAFIASGPTRLDYHHRRVTVLLRHPGVVLGWSGGRVPVVPPGATFPLGMLGTVRGGLELAEQLAAGALPRPDRLYAPLGSGGTVAGLALGLALGGVATEIHAVTAVERPLSTRGRLDRLIAAGRARLVAAGLTAARDAPVPAIHIDRSQIGPGYGIATPRSEAACARVASAGVPLEPIYSGKAMASLLAAAPARGQNVLFWVTPRRPDPLPCADDWRGRLPRALARRLT